MTKNRLPGGGMWSREDYTEEDGGKKRVKVSVRAHIEVMTLVR